MAVSFVLARLRHEPLAHLPIADLVRQACHACQHQWRDRLLTPLVTLRLFLLQILHGNTAINHLRQLSGLSFVASSYCEARERLPLTLITGLIWSLCGVRTKRVPRQHPAEALGPACARRRRIKFLDAG
jgi:hypothetical protein